MDQLKRNTVALSAALAVLTLLVFAQSIWFEFTYFDDTLYITENAMVQRGLTWDGVKYAFSPEAAPLTDPLAVVSHMLVVELFGLAPGPHHAVSLLLHLANVILLFSLLTGLTGSCYRSAFVAAVFAVHPFQVENVVWIADRKDVLCAFFWLLAAHAYAGYVRRPSRPRMAAVALLYALSLLAKPMAVTFPFVLLLLDAWPLNRAPLQLAASRRWLKLALEKWVLFAMCVPAAVLTWWMQNAGGAVQSTELLAPIDRISIASAAYAMYVVKTFWPTSFGIFYPLSLDGPNGLMVVIGAAIVLSASSAAIVFRDRWGALFTGWFWFIGMLVPVIGLVQVGNQAYADRYTYMPIVGLAIAVVWPMVAILPARIQPNLRYAGLAVLAILAVLSYRQAALWKTSEGIFLHTLNITGPNATIETNLGRFYLDMDRPEAAAVHLSRAAEIRVRNHLLWRIQLEPDEADAHFELGRLEKSAGNLDEAVQHFSEALRCDPSDPRVPAALSELALELGEAELAVQWADRAIELDPRRAEAYAFRGAALARLGINSEAEKALVRAVELDPANTNLRMNLANQLARTGRYDEALVHYEIALEQSPDDPLIWFNAGVAMELSDRPADAARHYRKALEIEPEMAAAAARLGRL